MRLTAVWNTVIGEGSFCCETRPETLTSCQATRNTTGLMTRYQLRRRRRVAGPRAAVLSPAGRVLAGAALGVPGLTGPGPAEAGPCVVVLSGGELVWSKPGGEFPGMTDLARGGRVGTVGRAAERAGPAVDRLIRKRPCPLSAGQGDRLPRWPRPAGTDRRIGVRPTDGCEPYLPSREVFPIISIGILESVTRLSPSGAAGQWESRCGWCGSGPSCHTATGSGRIGTWLPSEDHLVCPGMPAN
jgi:hypothetical protein